MHGSEGGEGFTLPDPYHLTSIWTIKLFNRCCDICKILRFKIPAIADIKSVDNKKAGPLLTLPKLRLPKVPLFKEKMHVHPRSRLNATPIFFF